MGLTRAFAYFVTADHNRIITGSCWIIGSPAEQQETERHRIFFEPGDVREVPGLANVAGYIVLPDGSQHAGRLVARDDVTLLLKQD